MTRISAWVFLFSLFSSTIQLALSAEFGCDTAAQNSAVKSLEAQGFKIARVFQTHVLKDQYGDTKYFELMPAYQLENDEGMVKFATCKGLYHSSFRAGEYISTNPYGGYVKVQPFMTPFYEIGVSGVRITGDVHEYGHSVDYTPFHGKLKASDLKFNSLGEVYEILLNQAEKGMLSAWGKAKRLIDPTCIAVKLPFSSTTVSGGATAENQEKSLQAASKALEREFLKQKQECIGAGGLFSACKKSRYPDSTTRQYRYQCDFQDFYDESDYSGTEASIHFAPNSVTTEMKTYPLLCSNPYPWRIAQAKSCQLKPITEVSEPDSELKLIDIRDSIRKEDIVVPEEVVIPPGGTSIRLSNHSSFYIEFKGSTLPAQGSLHPLKSSPDQIILKAMPGNELKLIPYPNRVHFIRFVAR